MATRPSIARQPKLGTSRLLHPLSSQRKMLMAVATHRATSGHPENPLGWAAAGLLAPQDEWEQFSGNWQSALAGATRSAEVKHPGSPVTTSEILCALLEGSKIAAVGCALSDATFTSLPQVERRKLLWSHDGDAALLCLRHCLAEAAAKMGGLPAEERVCFVMDWQDELASAALWFFEDCLHFSNEPSRQRLGSLGFESGQDFLPLRAAREFAQECSRRLGKAASDEDRQEPDPPLSRLEVTILGCQEIANSIPLSKDRRREWNQSASGL